MDRDASVRPGAAARFDPGRVVVSAGIADGRIVSAAVRSERPRGLSAALAGHPPSEIPDLARRLFALCGLSQATAARYALRAAGAVVPGPAVEAESDALVCERLVEHLRATVMGWSGPVPLSAVERAAVPAALSLAAAPRLDPEALHGSLARLGLADRMAAAGSWAERLLAFAAGLPRLSDRPPDPLSPNDDAAVVAALDRDGDAFAACPCLPGRRPQTGPAARAARGGGAATQPADRLRARLTEIAAAAAHLAGERRLDDLVVSGRLGERTGFAAVETPRGRLHHLITLAASGRVARFLIVAPTEWNFAPEGPCAAGLAGADLGAADPADTILRLAALYDPCVECRVEIGDAADRSI